MSLQDTLTDSLSELDRAFNSVEVALRESEDRFHSFLDEVPIAYHEINSEGVVVRVNRMECQILGYTADAMVGHPVWNFVAPDEQAESREAVLNKISGQRKLGVFTRNYISHNGSRLVMEVHENLMRDRRGKVTGIRSALIDITARRTAEEALELKAGELAAMNLELQQFAYVASHDLQEPLRKIQAFGDLLKTRCTDTLSEQGHDYLNRMQNAAGRMQRLINDLLSLSRAGTRTQKFIPVNLNSIVREVLSDLEIRIAQVGAKVTTGTLPTIHADPVQMSQLMQNLIGNGLKFHAPTEVPIVEISGCVLADGIHCQLIVEDHGIGFDEKYIERIFQVFQRLHGRSEFEGTGIGLSVCRRIAERHGGQITARSTPGQGSRFTVTLPILHPEESPQK